MSVTSRVIDSAAPPYNNRALPNPAMDPKRATPTPPLAHDGTGNPPNSATAASNTSTSNRAGSATAAYLQHARALHPPAQSQQLPHLQASPSPSHGHYAQRAAPGQPFNHNNQSHSQAQPQPHPQQHIHSSPVSPAPSQYPAEQKQAHEVTSSAFVSLAPLAGLPPRSLFPVNRFAKIRTIRKTLFGKVVLYYDHLSQRQVAIKLSDKQLLRRGTTTTGNKVAENPLEEIRIMNILSGQLIKAQCPITRLPADVRYGARYVLTSLGEFEDNDYLYTVMPFCGKGEFFDLVCHETRFSEQKAKVYFLQMVLGVRLMHALGMAHLDLSLENLLMTDSNELKICDYGVTRHLELDAATGRPLPFPAALTNKPGKLGYMSKEIFASQPFSGPLSDVWSMGIILFISLFGVPPYQVPALSDQRFALIVTGQIRRLLQAWKMNELVSEDAVALISDMLCDEDKRISIEQILQHPWLRDLTHRQAAPTPGIPPIHANTSNSSHRPAGALPVAAEETKAPQRAAKATSDDVKRMDTQ